MTDALEDHEGTVSIGARTITNLRFADDIDGLAGEEEELVNLVERLEKKPPQPMAWRSVPRRPSFGLFRSALSLKQQKTTLSTIGRLYRYKSLYFD